jgi:hypothetical protein
MSAWSEYKKKVGDTKPWDSTNIQKATEEEFQERIDKCKACDKFIKSTEQCFECKCVMTIKAKVKDSTCPLNKW